MRHTTIYRVIHYHADGAWHVEEDGQSIGEFATRDAAVHEAQLRGRAQEQHGSSAQLLIHRKDGPVQLEYAYGPEPSRRRLG